MNTHADKTQEKKNQSVANAVSQKKSEAESTFQFVYSRPKTIAQRKLQEKANNSPRSMQLKTMQDMANNKPQVKQAAQSFAMADNHSGQQQQPIQKKENNTGLPDNLKAGIENLSGYSMDDVKVHRNSNKPAQLQAHAYAQGTDIHLGAGQEKHLPHEAWHVAQQKQARVKPTIQVKGIMNVNDDITLEKEADEMGEKALQAKWRKNYEKLTQPIFDRSHTVLQRALVFDSSAVGSNRLMVDDSRSWKFGLAAAMPVANGEARCHIISFEAIRLGVWQATVAYLYHAGTQSLFINDMTALVKAIFPYGATSGIHNTVPLNDIAKKLYAEAHNAIDEIIKNKSNDAIAIQRANDLVLCLNSSPDNLRGADASTNSSIGGFLDPRGGDIQLSTLYGTQFFLITGATALQLLELSLDQRKRLIQVYMDSNAIQNSEVKNMLANVMVGGGHVVYIEEPTTKSHHPLL